MVTTKFQNKTDKNWATKISNNRAKLNLYAYQINKNTVKFFEIILLHDKIR